MESNFYWQLSIVPPTTVDGIGDEFEFQLHTALAYCNKCFSQVKQTWWFMHHCWYTDVIAWYISDYDIPLFVGTLFHHLNMLLVNLVEACNLPLPMGKWSGLQDPIRLILKNLGSLLSACFSLNWVYQPYSSCQQAYHKILVQILLVVLSISKMDTV
jgi:hypothetical protein